MLALLKRDDTSGTGSNYCRLFLYTPKKTETEKLSFFKKLRLKIEKKLKTEPKKLRSLEALCSGHSPKNSDYWRPYLVT